MSQAMKTLFCRASKVDEEKRTVTGIGASEAVDSEGEIFDYASSKPYVEAWSEGAQQRSQGKSFGNIRAQHDIKKAAGNLIEPIVFDDAQKLIILTAFISDDQEWAKCLCGTYTGFSILGPVVGEKWSDSTNPGVKRYTCAPIEFSVCDLPCNEEAVFTAVKAGGIIEERKFKAAAPAAQEKKMASDTKTKSVDGEELPKDSFAYRPSDNLADWKLPIKFSTSEKTSSHIRNALARWSSTEMPDANEKSLARIRIESAAKEHGIDLAKDTLKSAYASGSGIVKKSMYDIADLASIVSSLKWTQDGLALEADFEGDDSPIPAKLKSVLADLCDVLVELAREETSELVSAMKTAGAKKMVAKANQRDRAAISKCTKALSGVADCMTGKCAHGGIHKCAKAIHDAHKDATDAMSIYGDDADDTVPSAKAAGATVVQAAPISQQGDSPETGETDMTDAEKAQVAAAETNSAKALEVAEKTNAGMEQIAKALAGLTNLIAGEPVAPKSVTASAPVAVTKAAEIEGKQTVAGGTTHDVAKSIRSNPHYLSNEEAAMLRIGR
jgi:hypothetical protein